MLNAYSPISALRFNHRRPNVFSMGALLEYSTLKKSFKKLSRLSVFGITLALTKEPSVAISVLALTNDTWRLKC